MDAISLETRKVTDIKGRFLIPAYQRGFRWTDESIKLIEDILDFDETEPSRGSRYCLQPIVLKKTAEGTYELIDGQQRLTTLYLIYKAIKSYGIKIDIKFKLIYEIRSRAEEYLENLSSDSAEDNIDFFYIKNSFVAITDWLQKQDDPALKAIELYRVLSERVEIIWYEVNEEEDSNALFQRLNIGKIPLTSSELVKAIFLSEASKKTLSRERQEEIALQWDAIEKELHDPSFWGFLTNAKENDYQTRIDLILDLDSGIDSRSYEKYGTFFYFDGQRKVGKDLMEIWQGILHTFLILKDWYKNHEFYHKIGYLIAVNKKLSDIYTLSKGKTKKQFSFALDQMIRASIKSDDKDYSEMSYENASDHKKMTRLLLLFNVEAMRQNGEQSMWFPFDKYKSGKWSLEHIHAQHSEGMKDVSDWKEWLTLQLGSVRTVGELQVAKGKVTRSALNDLIEKMQSMTANSSMTGDEFRAVRESAELILSDDSNLGFMHSISNLALLKTENNAALSNSTFDVKRNKIIELDQNGSFIPYCTKMVFLKYYTNSAETQLHFWGASDRASYVKKIKKTLENYLSETTKITVINEEQSNG